MRRLMAKPDQHAPLSARTGRSNRRMGDNSATRNAATARLPGVSSTPAAGTRASRHTRRENTGANAASNGRTVRGRVRIVFLRQEF